MRLLRLHQSTIIPRQSIKAGHKVAAYAADLTLSHAYGVQQGNVCLHAV